MLNSHKSALLKNSDAPQSFEDPIVKEVRDARHQLAEQFGNDLQKVAKDLMRRQKRLGQRLLTR